MRCSARAPGASPPTAGMAGWATSAEPSWWPAPISSEKMPLGTPGPLTAAFTAQPTSSDVPRRALVRNHDRGHAHGRPGGRVAASGNTLEVALRRPSLDLFASRCGRHGPDPTCMNWESDGLAAFAL